MTSTDHVDRRLADQHADLPTWARERAVMLQSLYIHMLVFAVVNLGLFGINWATRDGDTGWWFQWPLLIWAVIGLGIHTLITFAPVFTDDWVERRARRLVDRDTRSG